MISEFGLTPLGPLTATLPSNHAAQAGIDVAIQDRQLVVAVTGEAFNFLTLDLQGTFVFLDAVAVEDTHLNNGAEVTRFHAQRGVAHVRGFLTEDGAQRASLPASSAIHLSG